MGGEAGRWVPARGRGAGDTAGPQLALTRHSVPRPKTLWRRIPPFLQFAGSSCPGLGACVLQILFTRVAYLRVHYHSKLAYGLSAGLVRDKAARVVAVGWGVVFSKLPLTFVQLFVPFHHASHPAARPPLLPNLPR